MVEEAFLEATVKASKYHQSEQAIFRPDTIKNLQGDRKKANQGNCEC